MRYIHPAREYHRRARRADSAAKSELLYSLGDRWKEHGIHPLCARCRFVGPCKYTWSDGVGMGYCECSSFTPALEG